MEYRDYVITINTDEYLFVKGSERMGQTLANTPTPTPKEAPTLIDSAKAHIDMILDGKQEQVTLQELDQRVQDTEDGLVELGNLIAEVLPNG